MSRNASLLFCCALTLAVAASCAPKGGKSVPKERFQLRVSLYPYLPDAESLVKWVENDFESKHRDVDLVVRPLELSEKADLAYDVAAAESALTGSGPDSQHLVEIDTLILGALASRKAIVPFSTRRASLLPSARNAVTWRGSRYGVPHWTCGYFVISQTDTIRHATNITSLVGALSSLGTPRVDLAGDLDGSWDSILAYLDAFHDTHPARDLKSAVSDPPLDPAVEASFGELKKACQQGAQSHCGKDGVDSFAAGQADALIGYSERLHPILSKRTMQSEQLHIASATLGSGDRPTLFTDALVLSPRCSDARCKSAASRFVDYLVSDAVYEVLLLSLDVGTPSVPRYLLPATSSAFRYGRVRSDRLYGQLEAEIKGAVTFPNEGVPALQQTGAIRSRIKELLGLPK